MAGTLFGLGLSQRVDINGRPLPGWFLYIYGATTSTPATIYQDFGLSVLHPWPLEADGSGMLPDFWLPDGTYRARATTAAGIEIFDRDNIVAIGASSSGGGGGGGGGGSSVDATAIYQTGDPLWVPIAGTRTGWIRMNGRTFGSASSGATERANADTQALYEYAWNNFSDTLCPVSGGRGATAVADFTANKPIASLDMRGVGSFGLDDMGNSAASIIAGGTPTVAGSGGGAETVTLLETNLPPLTLTGLNIKYNASTNTEIGGSATRITSISSTGATTSSGGVTGTLGGSSTAVNKMSPYRLGTWFWKL